MCNRFLKCVSILLLVLTTPVISAQDELSGAERIKALTNQCWSLREKNPDSALILARKGIELCEELQLNEDLDQLNGFTGVILMHYKHSIRKAIPYLHRAMEIATLTEDSVVLAYSYNNLGDAYYLTGNTVLALEYARTSLRYFDRLNHTLGVAYGYVNLGLLYRFENKYDSSLYYFNKAIHLRKSVDNKVGIASAHLEIALTWLERGNISKAEEYFQISYELHEEIDNKSWMAKSLNGLARIHYEKGEYQEALDEYRQSLDLNNMRLNYFGIVRDKIGIGRVLSMTGHLDEGEKELKEALSTARQFDLAPLILESLEALTRFYLVMDNHDAANTYLNNFLFLQDSLYTAYQHETLDALNKRYEVSRELDEAHIRIRTEQSRQLYLVVIISLLVLFVGVILWRYASKRKMNRILREMNETKDKLFSLISHDMTSPFNTLLGFSELLKEEVEEGDLEEIKKYAEVINQTADDSYRLVSNLLEWSRAQRGKLVFQPDSHVLVLMIREVVGLLSHVAERKNIEVKINVDPELRVYADRNMLTTVIRNLISNAIKFTPDKGKITVIAITNQHEVAISVKDTGVGLNRDEQKKLFNLKSSFSKPGTNMEKGTGLGLIICKEFIEFHQGTITVQSREGQGSVFTIQLPLK